MRPWAWLAAYRAHPDPLVAAGNTLALMVGSNQPFYPIYAYVVAGPASWPSWSGLFSAPFFLMIPAVSRRWPRAGRAMMPVVGVLNTLVMTKAMGEASGLEMFLMPCALIAALLFRRSERLLMLSLLGLTLLVYFLLRGRYGQPWSLLDDTQYAGLRALNGASLAGLAGFLGLLFAGVLAEAEARTTTRPEG